MGTGRWPPVPQWILFDDNHLLVVNKPPGVPVQKDKTGDPCLLEHLGRSLQKTENRDKPPFLAPVHRIDRPASGVVVVARSSKAASRLANQFRVQTTAKTYHVWLEPSDRLQAEQIPNLPDNDTLFDWIAKKPHGTSYIARAHAPRAKESSLTYRILKRGKKRILVEVDLHSGRHHQIRVQFASRGWVVVGDKRYGAKRALHDKSIALHAHKLALEHPTRKEMLTFTAPYPDTWLEWGPKTGR